MHDGWEEVTLGELIDPKRPITYGVVQPGEHDPDGIPLVRGGDFSFGWKPIDDYRRVSPEIERSFSRARLKAGDLVITIKGDVGTAAIVPNFLEGANISQTNARIAVNPTKALAETVLAFLQSREGRRQIAAVTQVGAQPGLIFRDIQGFRLSLPPLSEQRKIAEILRTWDEALEKLTALRAAKERRLGALRAALLFGRLRMNGLRHIWAPTRLETVTHELTKRNGAKGLGRESVMGVTKAEGVVPMREQTVAANISRYKRLPSRAFAYNPMRINVGSIAMNERDEAVLVSPDYVVFACNAGRLDPDYLDHLRKTSRWAHYINSGGSGSVRQRTYYADLAELKLPLPDLDEQKAIAALLNTARADLTATEREIEALTRQKRGLMQKLLRGEWRVTPEAPVG
jgi:type I restriction enzyme S subunit